MLILIDGYNLIKNRHLSDYIEKDVLDNFIHQLDSYSKNKEHRIEFFLDGGPFNFSSKEKFGCVKIIYSGFNLTADDCIKDRIKTINIDDVLLVTSDVELQKYAKENGIDFVKSVFLNKFLREHFDKKEMKVNKSSNIVKFGNSSLDDEIEMLMMTSELDKDESEICRIEKDNSFTDTKKKKRINKKLNKL